MPLKSPIDLAMALQPGGVDSLLKLIDDHSELQRSERDKCKRIVLAELLILGNTGRRAGAAEVALAAFMMSDVALEELVIEAKAIVQCIPSPPRVN